MLFLVYILFINTAVFAARPTHTVDLGYARYEGFLNNNSGNINFLGIRYAAAPTGEACDLNLCFIIIEVSFRHPSLEGTSISLAYNWRSFSEETSRQMLAVIV